MCFFSLFQIELRQAARDLHRLQSKYEPTTNSTTTDVDTNSENSSTAEQTR